MNVNTKRSIALIGVEVAFAGSFLVGGLASFHGTAHAQPSQTVTVDGADYPVCYVEDCSDQPGQIGVWFSSDGRAWLSLGEYSVEVQR